MLLLKRMEGERARGANRGNGRVSMEILERFGEGRMLAKVRMVSTRRPVSKGFQIWVKHSFRLLFSLPSILLQRINEFFRLYSPHAPCPTIRFRSRRYIPPLEHRRKDPRPVHLLFTSSSCSSSRMNANSPR